MDSIALHVEDVALVGMTVSEGDTATLSVDGEVFSPDVYQGAYSVTPSLTQQVLPTAGMALVEDVTVEAVRAGSVTPRRPTLDNASGEARSKVDVTMGWVTGGSYSGSALVLDKQAGATVTPTESEQTAVAQYRWTTGAVKVAAIPSDYVGSAIDRRDGDDLTASGDTVTVPSGYYEGTEQKAVAHGSAATPATTITANPTVSVGSDGAITATVSASQPVTPTVSAGYVTGGTAGTVTVTGSATEQLTVRTSADMTVRYQSVTAPAGYYPSAASKSVQIGSATPSATKVVTDHTATVTPKVTKVEGYIPSGSESGTVVTVTASELVSGTKSVTANGTGIDVKEYASIDVAVPTFDALSWLGEGAELVATYAKESTLLSGTSYNGWTPSTTAKTIKSGATAGTYDVDMSEYDYVIRWQFYCEPVYGSSATNKARFVKTVQEIYQAVIRRPNSLANIASVTENSNACQTINTPSLMEYWNNNSSHTYTWSASYGIYAAATAATFASATATSTTLTVKRPSVSARCSTTYFSTGNAGAVTQGSTYFHTKGWLYRVKKSKSLAYNQYHNVCGIYGNGI